MSDFEFLKRTVMRDLVVFLMEDEGVSLDAAIRTVAPSRTVALLFDESTHLYRESPAYVYEYLKDELQG